MAPKTVKPFTVEFKGNKRRSLQKSGSAEDLRIRSDLRSVLTSAAGHAAARDGQDPGSYSALAAAEEAFGRFFGRTPAAGPDRIEVSTNGAEKDEDRRPVQSGRILTDLGAEDPIEALLRRKAEDAVVRRGAPQKSPAERDVAKSAPRVRRRPEQEAVARANGEKAEPLPARNGKAAIQRDVSPRRADDQPRELNGHVATSDGSAQPAAAPEPRRPDLRAKRASRAVLRRAKRNGVDLPFRAGERWKRRLPPACW